MQLVMHTALIRVDVHPIIGYGHLSRCLNLCKMMEECNWRVDFIGRGLETHLPQETLQRGGYLKLSDLAEANRTTDVRTWLGTSQLNDADECSHLLLQRGIQRGLMKMGYDLLIVDHYAIDSIWELAMLRFTKRIMVIDDLANRKHFCHYLLDQTPYPGREIGIGIGANQGGNHPYDNLVPKECQVMLGPEFVLLRQEYGAFRAHQNGKMKGREMMMEMDGEMMEMDGEMMTLLVSFGSSDFTGQTEKVLDSLDRLFAYNIELDLAINKVEIICGQLYPTHLIDKFRYQLSVGEVWPKLYEKKVVIHYGLSGGDTMKVMSSANLCIGAAGVSGYERCCLGVPSILICVADNQEANARMFADLGVASYLGRYDQWQDEHLYQVLLQYLDPQFWLQQYRAGRELVDGLGCARVLSVLEYDQPWNNPEIVEEQN